MLNSTFQTRTVLEAAALPPGWTEHRAPAGHAYYYNAETKQSTYTRPVESLVASSPVAAPDEDNSRHNARAYNVSSSFGQNLYNDALGQGDFRGGASYQHRDRRQDLDKPKHRKTIVNCAPWILITTKYKRRFVHNTETGQSFWKFPQNVMLAVIEMDRLADDAKRTKDQQPAKEQQPSDAPEQTQGNALHEQDNSDSYEEVEVTDEEGEDAVEGPAKRLRTDDASGPVDFDEGDIAYQLEQMDEEYDLDPEDYGEGADDNEDLNLSEIDSKLLFHDMLDDFHINPYTPFDTIIEQGAVIEDQRYTILSNMSARRAAYEQWSTDRIQKLKQSRKNQEKKEPRIPFLRFLHEHATPKLYWPEFKRKHKREPELRDTSLPDKEKEKFYREHISRLKLSESDRKADLKKLLKEVPLSQLNRSSTLDTLPASILTNVKFISLPIKVRDRFVEDYISTLPVPSDARHGLAEAEEEDRIQARKERNKREEALAERRRQVEEEKRKQNSALRHERNAMRYETAEIDRAKRVDRGGLMSHTDEDKP